MRACTRHLLTTGPLTEETCISQKAQSIVLIRDYIKKNA